MGMIVGGVLGGAAPGGGGFPQDTDIFIRDSVLTFHEPLGSAFDWDLGNPAISLPAFPGTVTSGQDRDMLGVIVGGPLIDAPSGTDFITSNPKWHIGAVQRPNLAGWHSFGDSGGNNYCELFWRIADGSADDTWQFPAGEEFAPFYTIQFQLGKNRNDFTRAGADELFGISAPVASTDAPFNIIGSGSPTGEFRAFELVYAHKHYTAGPPDLNGTFFVNNPGLSGGYLEMALAAADFRGNDGVSLKQKSFWVYLGGRYIFSSPDGDSNPTQTITYGPSITSAEFTIAFQRFRLDFFNNPV